MRVIKDYLAFLVHFTVMICLGAVIFFSIGYLLGCFIMWKWLVIPPMDIWGVTMEDLRIAVVAYFIMSIGFYSILKEKY